MSHRFTTRLEEDDFGDLILTIPYEACEELGWDIGTELDYEIEDNAFILRKAVDEWRISWSTNQSNWRVTNEH